MSDSPARTPVNIITGFLGAGKTTLLNRLLRQGFGGERVAVVVNDFGKIAVDALLIEHEEEGLLSLPNGCICCTLATDLLSGLDQLLRAGYGRIILEASGLTRISDLRTLLESPALAERCFLETVTAIVDPARFVKLRKVVATMDEQISGATVVVLNRADVADDGDRDEARAAVAALNPAARIVVSSFCALGMDALRGGAAPPTGDPELPGQDHWSSFTIRFDAPVDPVALRAALAHLPAEVFRLKGFVRDPVGAVLHVEWAGGPARLEPWTRPVDEEAADTLVVIGRETLTPTHLAGVLGSCPQTRCEQSQSDHHHH